MPTVQRLWTGLLSYCYEEIRKIKGLPVARYDDKTKRAFLEYPDGRREYVGQ